MLEIIYDKIKRIVIRKAQQQCKQYLSNNHTHRISHEHIYKTINKLANGTLQAQRWKSSHLKQVSWHMDEQTPKYSQYFPLPFLVCSPSPPPPPPPPHPPLSCGCSLNAAHNKRQRRGRHNKTKQRGETSKKTAIKDREGETIRKMRQRGATLK